MKIEEVSKRFEVSLEDLHRYEENGLLDDVHQIDGIREYEDQDIKQLSKIITLKKAGFPLEEIKAFMLCKELKSDKNKRLNILKRQRARLLDRIHEDQKSIDCVDMLIYEIQGCPCCRKEGKR